ncbi:hypothetical protein D3OALGB2SA_5211 [Olavius algarvensis associated proteobacterium Delta 3]|nr:hypothetical protein D3OALGB2SA_5211 [Olavius algarvensis associated proteobacterium Delta 3]
MDSGLLFFGFINKVKGAEIVHSVTPTAPPPSRGEDVMFPPLEGGIQREGV